MFPFRVYSIRLFIGRTRRRICLDHHADCILKIGQTFVLLFNTFVKLPPLQDHVDQEQGKQDQIDHVTLPPSAGF